jgi:hypothetical protein
VSTIVNDGRIALPGGTVPQRCPTTRESAAEHPQAVDPAPCREGP